MDKELNIVLRILFFGHFILFLKSNYIYLHNMLNNFIKYYKIKKLKVKIKF